jgi:hypothetical protein
MILKLIFLAVIILGFGGVLIEFLAYGGAFFAVIIIGGLGCLIFSSALQIPHWVIFLVALIGAFWALMEHASKEGSPYAQDPKSKHPPLPKNYLFPAYAQMAKECEEQLALRHKAHLERVEKFTREQISRIEKVKLENAEHSALSPILNTLAENLQVEIIAESNKLCKLKQLETISENIEMAPASVSNSRELLEKFYEANLKNALLK